MTAPSTAIVQSPARPTALLRPIAKPPELLAAQNETRTAVAELLVENRDYGLIPGTKKKSLLQPGAERINTAFGVIPRFKIIGQEIDHDRPNVYVDARGTEKQSRGLYRYIVECELVLRETGDVVGSAIASCSSLEAKYVSRPRESENTVLQMAEKRAVVRATRGTFGLSDEFTQDMVDEEEKPADREAAQAQATAPIKEMTLEEARAFLFPFNQDDPAVYNKPLGTMKLKHLKRVAQWSIDKNREAKDYKFLEAVQLLVDEDDAKPKAQVALPFDQPASSGSSAVAAPAASPSPASSSESGSSPMPPSTSGASTTGTTTATATATAEPGTAPLPSTMKPAAPHTGPADPTSRHAITQELKALCDDERLAVSLREASRAVLKNPNATLAQLTRRVEEMRARLPKDTRDADVAERELRNLENTDDLENDIDDDLPF